MNLKRLLSAFLLIPFLTAQAIENWPPPGLSGDDTVYVVPIEVESVSASPVGITFRIHHTAYDLNVYRKQPHEPNWGNRIATIPAGTETWTHDTTNGQHAIQIGTAYEYRFHAQGVPSAWDSNNVRTYVMAGINVDRSGWRGRVVLVMPESIQEPLAFEIQRFKEDLVGDGWTVHDVLTPDGRTDFSCAQDGHHVGIRNDIIAIYNAHPGEVKHVILLGRVPQPRSGQRVYHRPDGHGDLGAVAADMYYADVDNTWTDTLTLNTGTHSVNSAWQNVPGDGRFDQSHFRHLSEAFEMGWGRIDFRGSVNGGDEIGALRNYLNKLHDYKHAQNGFIPGRRSVIRDAGGFYKHVQEEFWKVITPLSGMENLEYITGSDLPESAGQPEAQYTFDNGPYLYFFMAGNEPNQPSDNSRAVFWTGFKSHVGYHDLNGWTRSRLAEPNSWTLSWTFAPPRGRYVYHRMGLGGTMGDVMLATINNQSSSWGCYGSAVKNYINGAWTVQNPSGATNDYGGFTFHNHMGDPTLRDQMIESPQWVRGRLQNGGVQVQVEWLASPDATHGYDVYSAPSTLGPFTKRNGEPLHVNELSGELTWQDTAPPSDPVVYMVRALKHETTSSGSYLNASVGRMVEVDRSPEPFAIATTDIPNAYLGSAYTVQLETEGGNPLAFWSLVSGSLPAGLSLSSSGLISGIPTNAGSFPVTLEAVDLQGAVQSASFSLNVDMFADWTLVPNGDFSSPPTHTGTVAQWASLNNWQHPAAPHSQWDYDVEHEWAVSYRDGRTGAQPGLVYVLQDNQTQTGAVAFRYDLINTDGTGKPNTLYVRIYGVNGDFSWDHWNLSSNPSGDATLLHIEEITGSFGWTSFETPALEVGSGYQYYLLRFYPSDVTQSEGDFMAIDNLYCSTAAPPPVFYDVTFSAGPNGSLSGDLIQTVAGGGSTSPVTAVPAETYELAEWTWTGGGSSTENPLVIPNVSGDLTVQATFQLFNHPPVSTITSPSDGSSFYLNTAIPFSGTGSDVEDGTITAATWSSSIDGIFTPVGGSYSGLSAGEHVITRTVTDSGGKSGSASVTIILLEPIVRGADADTHVRGDGTNGDTNYGGNNQIRVRANELCEALFRFDVSGVPGHLVSATLQIVQANATTNTVYLHEVTQNAWGEMTVTYNNRPGRGNLLGSVTMPGVNGQAVEFDVTEYVAARAAADGLASFYLVGEGTGLTVVWSKEANTAANHPRLVLVYSLEEPPPSNTPPTVTITAPVDGTTVTEGENVTFTGMVTDEEDGDLTASAVWTSSVNGTLSSGGSVSTTALSVGTHTITLSVTDSGDLTGSDSITLTVEEPAPPPPSGLPAGFISVLDFDADPTGTTDSTAQLQAAINHGIENQVAVWLPGGEYRISERLLVDQPDEDPNFPGVLIGSTVDPENRAVIVLAANSAGFNNPNARRAMLHFFNVGTADNESGENTLYNQAVIGIDFRVESGNDGAVAIRMQGAEGCTIQDVNIDLTAGGHTGIWGVPGSGGTTHQVSVTGGVIGIDTRRQDLAGGGSQPTVTITGSSFVNQSDVAVWSSTRGAMVLVGNHFERNTPGPLLRVQRHFAGQPLDGILQVVDARMVYATHHEDNTVIEMAGPGGRSFYLENVFVQNGQQVWTEEAPANPSGWMRFDRLAAEVRPGSQSWGQPMELVWINGQPQEGILVESESGVTPPADLISRHQWGENFPAWETPGAVNALDHGAAGDGVTDDYAVLQALIDAHDIVFLPKGHYRVSDTLNLRPESKLIGVHHNFSVIEALSTLDNRFAGTTEAAGDRPIVSTADSAAADTVIAFLHLKRHYPLAQHNPTPVGNYALEWRSGGDSVLRSVRLESRASTHLRPDLIARHFYDYDLSETPINPNHPQDDFGPDEWAWPGSEPTVQVRGHGGGRWFGFWVHGRQALRSHVPFLRVEGTREPLHLYHLHLQQQDSVNHAEFLDVENVSVYGTKAELKGTLLYFEGSRYFRVFGSGGLASPDPARPNPYLFRFVNCDDFQISGFAETVNAGGNQWIGGPFDRWMYANVLQWQPVQDTHSNRSDVVVPSVHRPLLYLREGVTEVHTTSFLGGTDSDALGTESNWSDGFPTLAKSGIINRDALYNWRMNNQGTDWSVSFTGGNVELNGTNARLLGASEWTMSGGSFSTGTAHDLQVEGDSTFHLIAGTLSPRHLRVLGAGSTFYQSGGMLMPQNDLIGGVDGSVFKMSGGSASFGTLTLNSTALILAGGSFTVTDLSHNIQRLTIDGNADISISSSAAIPQSRFNFNNNWLATGTDATLTVQGWAYSDFESLFTSGRMQYDGVTINAATFEDTFEVEGSTLSVRTGDEGPDPYEVWAAENNMGDPTDLTDGVPNLLRYALGGTAQSEASELFLVPQVSGNGMTLSFNRINDLSLTYEVWATDNLLEWGLEPYWIGGGGEPIEVPVTATGNQLYLYLRVRRE